MKLEIGSGHNPRPGYKHLEINKDCPEVDYVGTMESIPCEDNTFDEVLSIHSIEHVSIVTAKKALREWLRVLKPGGFAHIDTPNFERTARLFLDPQDRWRGDFDSLTQSEKEFCSLNGVPNKTMWACFKCFSSDVKFDTHFWNASPELLVALCLDAGFSKAEVVQTEPSLIVKAYKGE